MFALDNFNTKQNENKIKCDPSAAIGVCDSSFFCAARERERNSFRR